MTMKIFWSIRQWHSYRKIILQKTCHWTDNALFKWHWALLYCAVAFLFCVRIKLNNSVDKHLLPLILDQMGLIMIWGWRDSILEHYRHGNDSEIDLMFDPFDPFGLKRIVVMFYDWFRALISINPLLMHYHRYDCGHIQYYNCSDVATNAHEYPPMRCVSNSLKIYEIFRNSII